MKKKKQYNAQLVGGSQDGFDFKINGDEMQLEFKNGERYIRVESLDPVCFVYEVFYDLQLKRYGETEQN